MNISSRQKIKHGLRIASVLIAQAVLFVWMSSSFRSLDHMTRLEDAIKINCLEHAGKWNDWWALRATTVGDISHLIGSSQSQPVYPRKYDLCDPYPGGAKPNQVSNHLDVCKRISPLPNGWDVISIRWLECVRTYGYDEAFFTRPTQQIV